MIAFNFNIGDMVWYHNVPDNTVERGKLKAINIDSDGTRFSVVDSSGVCIGSTSVDTRKEALLIKSYELEADKLRSKL